MEQGRSMDPLARLRLASEKFDFLVMDPPSSPMEYVKKLAECKTEIEAVMTNHKYLKNPAEPILDQVLQELNKNVDHLLKKLSARIDKIAGDVIKSGLTKDLLTGLADCKKEFNFLKENSTKLDITDVVKKQLESCDTLVRAGLKTDEPSMGRKSGNTSANNSREGSPRKP